MEFSKSFRISTDYRDKGSSPNWDMLQFAEVLFVDKTNPVSPPLIFQLKDQKLSLNCLLNANHFNFSRDAFIFVGEALTIDKKKKQVVLTNNNTIAYNHLVIAFGNKPIVSCHDDELLAALQTLMDALRVKPKIPSSFPKYLARYTQNETTFAIRENPFKQPNVEKIVHPYIVSARPKFHCLNLNSLNKRLYEVHI